MGTSPIFFSCLSVTGAKNTSSEPTPVWIRRLSPISCIHPLICGCGCEKKKMNVPNLLTIFACVFRYYLHLFLMYFKSCPHSVRKLTRNWGHYNIPFSFFILLHRPTTPVLDTDNIENWIIEIFFYKFVTMVFIF